MANKQSFDKGEFYSHLTNLNDVEKKLFLKTYNKYKYYNEIFVDNDQMKNIENRIYTIYGTVIDDYKRVEIELNRIQKNILKESKSIDNYDYFYQVYNETKELIIYLKESNDSATINKLKKNISYLQIMLGLNTYFFKDVIELFEDKYNDLIIDEIENKKVR